MRRFKLSFHPTITFLVTVLTTVYVCNLTIAFKRSFLPDVTEFDPLSSFRAGGADVRARAVEASAKDRSRSQNLESNLAKDEASVNIAPAQEADGGTKLRDARPQSREIENQSRNKDQSRKSLTDQAGGQLSDHSDEEEQLLESHADPASEEKSSEDEQSDSEEADDTDEEESEDVDEENKGNNDIDAGDEYPAKAHVVPLLNSTIRASPRSKEWWRRKEEGTQRRHDKAMAYVAKMKNITLPSSLKERVPAFQIIGAQKSGTTALRTYLSKHPLIEVPIDVGETHFFDKHFPENATNEQLLDAYVEQFFDRDCRKRESYCIAGESTPIYLFDTEHVPARVKSVCPWTKFIVLLRDPVKRAISHCNMLIERKEIKDTFEMRLERDFKWMMANGLISNVTLSHEEELEAWRRYLNTEEAKTRWKKLPIGRGFYELQLQRWFQYFPRGQFLILKSEDLDTDRAATMKRVFEFLGVPNHVAKKHGKKIHQRTYSFKAANDVRDFLYEFYRPYNERLAELLGPEWEGIWENPKLQKG